LLLAWPLIAVGVLKQARVEEQMLLGKFGSRYEDYAGTTGRLVPKLSGSKVG
jgi:protein-S-isoprenylcysteine O-methyltransferase Ste14